MAAAQVNMSVKLFVFFLMTSAQLASEQTAALSCSGDLWGGAVQEHHSNDCSNDGD